MPPTCRALSSLSLNSAMSDPPIDPVTVYTPPDAAVLWLLRVLALAAAGVAGYLLFVSWTEGGLPVGCGEGSGCKAVLTSQWSRVGPVPVSAPALLLYLGLFVATFWIGPGLPTNRQRA